LLTENALYCYVINPQSENKRTDVKLELMGLALLVHCSTDWLSSPYLR